MLSASRIKRRTIIVAGRALCVSAAIGLGCSVVPASVSASPVVMGSPSTPNIVGLGQGAKGDEVRAVQQALITAGVPVPGGADGVYGPATQSAVTAFQARKGLGATGTIDAATASALGLALDPSAVAPAATPTATPAALTAASPAPGAPVVGATGPGVVALQQALMAAGVWLPRGADGVFGAATTRGISNFQSWNRLTVSGVVDAPTFARLKIGAPAASPTPPAPAPPAPAPPAPAPTAPAPTTPASSPFSGMRSGARGDNVRVLQRALIAAGITIRGGADGVFGALTTSALTTFQQSKGLAATGVVDDATIASLALSPSAPAPGPAPVPAAPVAASPYVGLTLGATGDRVRELQRALMTTGLVLRGGADGSFGNATRTALIAFQKTNNVAQTGVVSEGDAKLLGLGSTSTAPQGVAPTASFATFGERGARVTTLQQALITAGITIKGGADGIFGAATAGAIMEFQRRSGLTPTGKLDDQTANRLGSAPAPAPAPTPTVAVTIDVFPVQGRCWFGDTWMAPRGGGRLHEGVDIIAPKGNLLYAAVTGRVSRVYTDFPGALAGNGLRIQQDNGTYFTYLHLDTFAEGIALGVPVTAGQVIGTVGTTGNSATPHLHFEVHPGGGAAVNPFPLVKPIDACNVTAPRA